MTELSKMAVYGEEQLVEFGSNERVEYRSGTMDNAVIDGRNPVTTATPGVFSVSLSHDQ